MSIEDVVSYDYRTGKLYRLNNSAKSKAGDEITAKRSDGYIYFWAMGRKYRGHIVAWYLHYGEWPKSDIDHINGDRSDNRIVNLRLATKQQNLFNRNNFKSSSKFKGVQKRNEYGRDFYVAKITKSGKQYYLGCFSVEEEAAMAYNIKAKELFSEFASFNMVF